MFFVVSKLEKEYIDYEFHNFNNLIFVDNDSSKQDLIS